MSNWKEYKLGDFAEIQTGPFGSQLHASDYVEHGIPSIMPTNIGSRLNIDTTEIACVSAKDIKRLEKYTVRETDIVYSRRGDVEKCAYITSQQNGWLCGTGCLRIRFTSKEIVPRFCSYYLSTPDIRSWVTNNAVGTTMPNLNSKILQALPLNIPSLKEQESIAEILSSLDDKIDLLHRQNKTLEEMAETLFRQWFVEEVADETNKKMKLEQIVDQVNGISYKGVDLQPSTIGMITLKNFDRNGGFRHDGYKEYVGIFKDQHIVLPGDLLVAHTDITQDAEVIGNPILIPSTSGYSQLIFSMDLVKVISRNREYTNAFLYFLMRTREFKEHCLGYSNGSTVLHLSKRAIPEFEFKKPAAARVSEFSLISTDLLKKLDDNQRQIQSLVKMRDSMLPKLMSGEILLS